MKPGRPVTILLVEDNPDHAELTQRVLASGRLLNTIVWLKDGEEALDFLFRRRAYRDPAAAPRPGLILLDIRLPKVDGLKVLRAIKDDPELASIPVIMLTTSAREDEVTECYQAGASSFVTKPVQFPDFVQQIQTIKLYCMLTSDGPEV